MLRRTLALAAATLSLVDAAATSSSICQSAAFQALTPTQLGSSPLLVRSLVNGTEVCFEFQISESTSATWFAVGLAASSSMVNSPTSNVMLYQASVGTPESYVLSAYSSSGVKKESDQSFFVVHETSTSPLKFSYQRTLAASSSNDVVANPSGENEFIWAYGTSWPISSHRSGTKGSAKYTLTTSTASGGTTGTTGGSTTVTISTPSTPFCDGKNCTAIVGGIAFAIMLVCGFVLTAVIPHTPLGRALLQRTLTSPPVKLTTNAPVSSPHVMFLQCLADLRLGEVLIVLIFAGALAALVILNNKSNEQKTSGQAALLIMMFLILPVTRIPLWKISFGSSFERIVKFHRWLGMALSITTFIHLLEATKVVDLFSSDKYSEVYPIWGMFGFIAFILIALTANEYMRRRFFDAFYISHRVLSIVGFVFTILHSAKTIGLALLVPLVFYALGVVSSWATQYSSSYQATVSVHEGTSVVTLLLNSTEKTKKIAQTMDLCSYFYVRIPTVSGFQWHPFSAIVTPNGDSIGFCIRAMGPPDTKTFTRALVDQALQSHSLAVNLSGPFGKLSVDIEKYDVIVLIGGGIGVTPLLSALNQHRLFAKKSAKAADWNILWSVRYPQDLLMIDQLMPSQGQLQYSASNLQEPYQIGSAAPPLNATWNTHCSEVKEDGVMTRANGEQIAYRAGIPVLDEYINTGRYMGRKVAVLACGPPTMVVEAQSLARSCGFDFHKEVFHW